MQQRFEATFDDGDEDRWPRWCVVEWVHVAANGARVGNTVESFAGTNYGREQAEELAYVLNREHSFGEYA